MTSRYVPVALEEEQDVQVSLDYIVRLRSSPDMVQDEFMTKSRWRAAANVSLQWLNLVMMVISISCLILAYDQYHRTYQWHLQQTSAFSPFLNKIDLGEVINRYEVNELFNRPLDPYRDAPSDEVDVLWESIADIGIVMISDEDVLQLGKDPSKTVKAPKHWGFGDNAHLAQIDGQHRLHCLNVLRKWAHYDYYFRPKHGDDPGVLQSAHRDHCLALLLHALTCQPSLDVITHNWVDTQPYPVPDFNMNRKCKNHQRIVEWQDRNRITMEQWDNIAEMARPSGDFVFPLWPELVELNRQNELNVTG